MDVSLTHILILSTVAFFAGTVDAIAGGGGLIQLPALFLVFPSAAVAPLLGTNKFSSIWGTGVATVKYLRHVKLDVRRILPSAILAGATAMAGAVAVSYADPEKIKPAIAVVLVAVLLFTVARNTFGVIRVRKEAVRFPLLKALMIAGLVGFYDGFLGPGTGVFLVFGFVGLMGMDFLEGSASAKVINLATNVAAIGYFASSGLVEYRLGVPMAFANVVGGYIGSHMAIAKGSTFVRKVFLIVVGLILMRLSYDILTR
ncbi:MAG: sulfite exporter TauE/SafE family protein [Oligoflexales bacterium]